MADNLKGKTKAELVGMLEQHGDGLTRTAIHIAIGRLDEAERSRKEQREDSKFEIRIQTSRRQSRHAVIVAWFAVAVSVATLVYTVYHDSHSRVSSPQSFQR